ncbi:MAG: lycopene cyclase family protein [Myxococcota bacterium]
MSEGYAIVGAGLAGLSLAVHLVEAGFDRPLTLFDRRREFVHDRTWCGFATGSHRFSDCVTERWTEVEVRDESRRVRRTLERHPYEHIPAPAFYEEALGVLRAAPQVTLRLGTEVLDVRAGEVVVDGKSLAFAHVFDGRPPELSALSEPAQGGLWQGFVGAVVETDAPRFNPHCAILMDFAMDGAEDYESGLIAFRYVLPFSERRALIEETVFAADETRAAPAALGGRLSRWRARLGKHTVSRRESGLLPMFLMDGEAPAGVTPIGLRAGAAKASTGYAFDFIQRHSRALVADRHASIPRISRAGFLDAVLLRELRRRPESGPRFFRQLFERMNPDSLARFLTERSTLWEDLAMMASVPNPRLMTGGIAMAPRTLRRALLGR